MGQGSTSAGVTRPSPRQSNPSTPAMSPNSAHRSMFTQQQMPPTQWAVPHPVPLGRKSREGSMFSNGGEMSNYASPVTPIESSSFTPNNRHAFSPMTSSALASSFPNSSFPNSSFPSTLSTTPIDPPTWTQNGISAGSLNWNAGPPQPSASWPEIPQASDGNEELDPALFDTLAKLLEQTQGDTTKPGGDGGEFDLMNAIQQAMASAPISNPSHSGPSAPVPAPAPQQGSGLSQSLLTRRLQHQGPAQPQANYSMFNLNGGNPPVQPGSLPNSLNGPSGSLPTPPQSFASSLSNYPPNSQMSNWPVPDRAMPWSETPASTPGGSGRNSPSLAGSHNSPYFSQMVGSSSRNAPVNPIRREAPQHPSIQQSPHGVSVGSTHSNHSSRHPSVDYGQAQNGFPPRLSQIQTQMPQQPAQLPQSAQPPLQHPQPPSDWTNAGNIDMSNLPPLPPGFSLEQMGQMGSSGFEMALRMGMSLAMMSQNTSPADQSGATPGSTTTPQYTPSGQASVAASPADIAKHKFQSPVVGQSEIFGPRSIPKSLGTSPTLDMPAGASSFPISRRPSQGEVGSPLADLISPEDAANKDPLAAQVWKAYARAREALPNGHRMENLTWRMMHLTLKKQEELAAAAAAKELQEHQARQLAQSQAALASQSSSNDGERRGRSKGKSRVVGFQNEKEDSPGPE